MKLSSLIITLIISVLSQPYSVSAEVIEAVSCNQKYCFGKINGEIIYPTKLKISKKAPIKITARFSKLGCDVEIIAVPDLYVNMESRLKLNAKESHCMVKNRVDEIIVFTGSDAYSGIPLKCSKTTEVTASNARILCAEWEPKDRVLIGHVRLVEKVKNN